MLWDHSSFGGVGEVCDVVEVMFSLLYRLVITNNTLIRRTIYATFTLMPSAQYPPFAVNHVNIISGIAMFFVVLFIRDSSTIQFQVTDIRCTLFPGTLSRGGVS